MTDREFFYRTLGLSAPWEVGEVKLDLENRRVEVRVAVADGTVWGEDGALLPIAGYEEREWRHLDTMQLETVLQARVPRVRYPDGSTRMVKVPWAEAGSRWTLAFEALAIEVLRACGSVNEGAGWLRLDWRAAQRIMDRAVRRGLERRQLEELPYLGMDEKSFRKGHRYGTLVNDLEGGRVLEVTAERTTEAAAQALRGLGAAVLKKVAAVAIDMSAPYAAAIKECCPQAEVVHDKFHVSALLGEAVDKTRREENARLQGAGDATLKGTRYDWLYDPARMSEERFVAFKDLVRRELATAKAWHHRALFVEFWNQRDASKAEHFFKQWFARAVRSKLKAVVAVARTLKNHLEGLLAYFRHRITNALSESLNSRIQSLKNSARGFHRFDRFRTRILFFLGGLDLQPR
jgi:transposase